MDEGNTKVYVGNRSMRVAGCDPILDTNDYNFDVALAARGKSRRGLTLERFVKHASRFGTESVFETAQTYLSDAELRTLDTELSRMYPKRKRLFTEDARNELDTEILRLAETVPVAQVAIQTGKSTSYVYRVLREAETAGASRSMSTEGVTVHAG